MGDPGSIPMLGRSPREGKGYPLQYAGLENSMDCISPWSHRVEQDWAAFTFTYCFIPSISSIELLSHVWLFANPMNYTVHGILQARILEWVAFPFSRRSTRPRNWTGVSCTAGEFFTSWATREAHVLIVALLIMEKTWDTTWMSNYRWIWKEKFNHTVISLLWNYNHEKWCQRAAFSNVNLHKNILGILLKWIFWFNRSGGDT